MNPDTLSQGWKVGGHALSGSWLEVLSACALALVAALYLALVLRALVRRAWYRATDVLGPADLRAVHEALADAEKKTVGEILPVVLERSDRHAGARVLAALTFLVLGTGVLLPWLPWGQPVLAFALQCGLAALGYASAWCLPDFARLFVGEARALEVAEEQALQEFYRHDLFRTEARTGVLLFVSLLERRAIVLADEGIHAKVRQEQWSETNAAVLAGLRQGSLRAGLIAGIRSAGQVLAQHFPVAAGDRNEIPDRVIVRRE